jgi:hypothetical protein
MKPTKVIQILEGLVGSRFSMETLNTHLQNEFNLEKHLEIEDVTKYKDECDTSDYNLMCCLDAHGIFCDIDIYFLKLRKRNIFGEDFQVVEVGYEFDMRE